MAPHTCNGRTQRSVRRAVSERVCEGVSKSVSQLFINLVYSVYSRIWFSRCIENYNVFSIYLFLSFSFLVSAISLLVSLFMKHSLFMHWKDQNWTSFFTSFYLLGTTIHWAFLYCLCLSQSPEKMIKKILKQRREKVVSYLVGKRKTKFFSPLYCKKRNEIS